AHLAHRVQRCRWFDNRPLEYVLHGDGTVSRPTLLAEQIFHQPDVLVVVGVTNTSSARLPVQVPAKVCRLVINQTLHDGGLADVRWLSIRGIVDGPSEQLSRLERYGLGH